MRIGHGYYLAFLLAGSNFIIISYEFVVRRLPFIAELSLPLYATLFITLYGIIVLFIGRWHRQHQFKTEQAVMLEEQPYIYRMQPGKEKVISYPLQLTSLEIMRRTCERLDNLTVKAGLDLPPLLNEKLRKEVARHEANIRRLQRGELLE